MQRRVNITVPEVLAALKRIKYVALTTCGDYNGIETSPYWSTEVPVL